MTSAAQENHRDVTRPPESLEYVTTVLIGQTYVQQDEIRLMPTDGVKGRGAASRDIDTVSLRSEQPRKELTEIKVVVDDP
jgi:hypothetical protein